MNTYVNKRTGATFETECSCAGESWELVKSSQPAAAEKPQAKRRSKEKDAK